MQKTCQATSLETGSGARIHSHKAEVVVDAESGKVVIIVHRRGQEIYLRVNMIIQMAAAVLWTQELGLLSAGGDVDR
jgi:hypothetical protein